MFLDNGGMKGPQVAILRPGTYRINMYAFKVMKAHVTEIPPEKIGVVIANDGEPLPSGIHRRAKAAGRSPTDVPSQRQEQPILPGWPGVPHERRAQGPAAGYPAAGTLLHQPACCSRSSSTMSPKSRPAMWRFCGRMSAWSSRRRRVSRSERRCVGPASPGRRRSSWSTLGQPVHEDVESLLILDKNMRGIWKEPIAPGKYNLNPLAFTAYLVPTSAVTIDWASGVDQRAAHESRMPRKERHPDQHEDYER